MDPRVAAALKVEDEKYNAGVIGGEKYVNLRDEFAKAAMQAHLMHQDVCVNFSLAEIASDAYAVADAMLAARNA